MIARMWRGWVRPDDAPAYAEYIERTGLADYRQTPGNRGAWMFQRRDGERMEIVTLSFWDSYEAVSRFAGADISRARFYPEDEQYLIGRELCVTHYEVVSGDPTASGSSRSTRTPVSSSVLVSVGYDPERLVLELELTSGNVYRYIDVPPSVHADLMRAESLGRFYNDKIKDNYDWTQA